MLLNKGEEPFCLFVRIDSCEGNIVSVFKIRGGYLVGVPIVYDVFEEVFEGDCFLLRLFCCSIWLLNPVTIDSPRMILSWCV